MQSEKIKNTLSFLLRIVLSFGLLYWLFQKIDVIRMVEIFKTADLRFIGLALAVFVLINFILLFRWFVLIRALGLAVHFFEVLRYFFIGLFCNLFFPSAIGGDVVKTFGLCRGTDQKAKVVASVLLDRLSGFASIVIVATVSYSLGYYFIQDRTILVMIVLLATLSFGVFAVLFNERLYSFGCRIFDRVPKIKNSLMNLHYDVVLIKGEKKSIVTVISLSVLCQILFAVVFWFLAKGLHHNIDMVYFVIFTPLVCVASTLPSIGGLGVREVGWAYLLAKVHVAESVSVSISLMSFFFMVVVGLLGGLFYGIGKLKRFS